MNLHETVVRPVLLSEEQEFQKLVAANHYLGALPKIGETLWDVALWREKRVALMTFSAAAWNCAARDQWIGWNFRHQYDRLKLVFNNSRFLILPVNHAPNIGTRILSLSQKNRRETPLVLALNLEQIYPGRTMHSSCFNHKITL
ncbi:MAG: DUF4338 domain-containing protein [Deltaproteobacteria bacterium]|nr:DUF4338 domain-containing protein [Deltaproteobacteria bacterium]